ncbi:RRP6-like 2 [Olea europaea subsp. europaea]|uniref:RRP6-like 2 n=1 Tax=Olea europaea subsp. europaea TaxID=158383 RepID=A0A8S0SFN1_OLEEU|nr:RRP6-like 2 [Olea europaea subsp. europaea]
MWFLLQVYKCSYDICMRLYEKELLTDSSYLYIKRLDVFISATSLSSSLKLSCMLQGASLNAQQLAVVSGLCEWRDVVARAEDESAGYVLPNRTLIEIDASHCNQIASVVVRNLGSVVSIIRHSIQNAHAFEEAAKYLQERRLETAIEKNTLVIEESEVLPQAPEIISTREEVENINDTLPNDSSISKNALASMECKDGAPMI